MNTRAKLPSESELSLFDEVSEHVELSIESGRTFSHRSPRSGRTYGKALTLPFAPGDVIAGKYQVIGLVGVGGVAFVAAVLHLDLGEMRALKFLRPESLEHDEDVQRFSSEARSAARIKSEHVCRVFDVGTLPEAGPFIVMEYLEGKDLSDILREQGRLPIKVAVDYVLQACEALASAHAANVVHRDVKPENLFLTEPANGLSLIKVLDFGISKSVLGARAQRQQRSNKAPLLPMGTPAYMSPEQVRDGDVDARADIWALGCVLFELLTGECAFDAPTLMQLGAAILEREPPLLRERLPEAPEGLEAIIERCLAKDPDLRYQNVAELAAELCPYGPRRARIHAERCAKILGVEVLIEVSARSILPASMSPAPSSSSLPEEAPDSATVQIEPEQAPAPPRRRGELALRVALTASLGIVMGAASFRLLESQGWITTATQHLRPSVLAASSPQTTTEAPRVLPPSERTAPALDVEGPLMSTPPPEAVASEEPPARSEATTPW